jgi:hypothetical protein
MSFVLCSLQTFPNFCCSSRSKLTLSTISSVGCALDTHQPQEMRLTTSSLSPSFGWFASAQPTRSSIVQIWLLLTSTILLKVTGNHILRYDLGDRLHLNRLPLAILGNSTMPSSCGSALISCGWSTLFLRLTANST